MSATQKTIRGRTFSFGFLPAETALICSLRIVKQIGETAFRVIVEFASMKGDITTKEGLAKLFQDIKGDKATLGALISQATTIIQQMDPSEYAAIAKTLLSSVTAERTPGAGNADHANLSDTLMYDLVFKGKPKLLWEVLAPALVENYRDFFDSAGTPSSLPAS